MTISEWTESEWQQTVTKGSDKMKPRPKSLPEKIRAIRRDLHHWMSLRQQNPVMGRDNLQDTAERESMRLAGILDRLEAQQRDQMKAIELARKEGRL